MPSQAAIQSTTQNFLDIFDITNDLIILADGAVAAVISVSAMNFGLLSEDEQDATIYAYAALLNSLSFPVEIVIRSQPKDVTKYLKVIEEKETKTNNPIYKRRIREYRAFVESLVQEQNVLDKKFFIVIPLSAVEMGLTTQSVIPGSKNKPLSNFERTYIIDKAKTNLFPRRDHLIDQLARIGLYSRQLNTQELIQMLYSSYNPESFEGQKVTDTENYTTPLVQAQIQGELTMTDQPITPTPTTAPAAPAAQVPQPTSPNPTPAPATPTPPPTPDASASMPDSSALNADKPNSQQTPLGVTTPANMSQGSDSMATPAAPQPFAPPATPAPAASGIQESEKITPPAGSTPAGTPTPTAAVGTEAPAVDEQKKINETLSALGTTPVNTAGQAPVDEQTI